MCYSDGRAVKSIFTRLFRARETYAGGGDVHTSRECKFAYARGRNVTPSVCPSGVCFTCKFVQARGRNVTPSGVCFARAKLARENRFRCSTLLCDSDATPRPVPLENFAPATSGNTITGTG